MGVKRITNGCSEAATLTVLRERRVRQGKDLWLKSKPIGDSSVQIKGPRSVVAKRGLIFYEIIQRFDLKAGV